MQTMCDMTFDVRKHTYTYIHIHEYTHLFPHTCHASYYRGCHFLCVSVCPNDPVSINFSICLSLSVSRLLSRWYSKTRLQAQCKIPEWYPTSKKKAIYCVDWSTPTLSRAMALSHTMTMASCWCGVSWKGSRLIWARQSPAASYRWGQTALLCLLAC